MSKQFQLGLMAIVFVFVLLASYAVWKKQKDALDAAAAAPASPVIEEAKPASEPAGTGQ